MKKSSLLILLFVTAFTAQAQLTYLKSTKEAKAKADEVMSLIVDGKSEAGFELLKPHWPIEAAQVDELGTTTATQIPMLETQFGTLKGYEFVKSEELGSFGYLVEYVIKYQKNALRLYIIFYNGGDGWLINTLRWDDRWDLFFDTRLKAATD